MSDYSVRPELLPALAALYEHEARMVTLSGGVGRQFTASWSKEELANEVGDDGQATAVFDFLKEEGRLVPLSDDRWRTDTCELVRLSSFNYNRFVRNQVASPTQAGVTWRVERKESPKWQHSVAEVLQMLGKEFSEGWVDGQGEHRYEEDPTLLEASEIVLNAFNALRNGEGSLSAFQYRSLRDLLRGSKSTGENTQIIEAGTGFGKSYGFQLGTLISLVHDRVLNERGHRDRVHTILLYPRVALVLDQRVGVIRLIDQINLLLEARGDVRTIEHVTDAKSMLKTIEILRWRPDLKRKDLEKLGILKATKAIYGGGRCPDIVIGNPDSLRNRMWDPVAARALQQGLRHLVFDEVHLLESIPGANGASFLRRLIARAESLNPEHDVMITASSATVAEEKEHVGKVFGRDPMTVTVSRPEEHDEWELSGLIHHVFHRSQDGESFESNLANLTSLVTHGRRRRATPDIDITPQDLQKTIGFADSLQLLGRWNYLMRDLEGLELTPTQLAGVRQGRADIASLSPSGNPQPFRFDRPLVHLAREGEISEATEAEVEQHCSKCIKGEPSTLPIPLDGRFGGGAWLLDQWGQSHALAHLDWTPTSDERLGITDGCPFFQMGACWREVTPADLASAWPDGPRAMPNPMTPLLLTSSTLQDLGEDLAKQKPDVYFLGDKAEAYRIRGNASYAVSTHTHHARIALSSPVMEVGVDLDNLTEAVLFKAIRNISSYRQKIGRLGRERYMDTYAATLASFRAIDYHYYRNPSPLLDNNSLEPIPLAVDNVDLVKQRLFHAIFDMFTSSPTAAGHLDTNESGGAAVEAAKFILDTHSSTIAQELHERFGADHAHIQGAIKAWHDLLDLFLEDHSVLFGTRSPTLAAHLGRPAKKINVTSAGAEIATRTEDLIRDFGVLAGHSIELRGSSVELDNLLDSIANGWKKVTGGKNAPELWDAVTMMTTPYFVSSIVVPLFQEKPNFPGTQFLLNFATNSAQRYKSVLDTHPEAKSYVEQGRFALFLSIRDWNMAWGASNIQDKWWYFRQVCQEMYMTMHNRPWIFPSTLFEPPVQHKVKVFVPRSKGPGEDDSTEEIMSLRDVMLGFLPGMWTYRHKGRPLKSKAYQNLVEMLYHDELAVQILPNEKHQFLPTNTYLSPDDRPWGMPNISSGQSVALLTPYQIILMNSHGPSEGNRVIPLEESGVRIADGDDGPQTSSESSESEDDIHPVNAPECLPIQWRSLVQTSPDPVEAYGQQLLDRGLAFDDDPIMATLFDSIEFDSGTQAKEFAYGHVRRLQAREAADVYLVDADHRPVAVGREFKTNAIRFHLSQDHAKHVLDEAIDRLRGPEGAADRIQAVHHVLMEHAELSRFKAEHIIRSALAKPDVRVSLSSMQDWAAHLRSITAEGIIQYDGLWLAATNKESGLAAKAGEIAANLQLLTDEVVIRATTTWALRTMCNSIGIALLQAARAASGCRDDDVNYHVELPRDASEQDLDRLAVWLYDTAEDGNGACETLRRWFHVPAVVREIARDRRGNLPNLPTRDFVDHLFRFLRPCVSHQAEALAFEAHHQGVTVDTSGLPRRLRNDFQFAQKHHRDSWDQLRMNDIASLREGQLLAPLLHPGDNVASERVQKATRACVTSCPQCLEEFGVSALGPLIGPLYANKRLLDMTLRLAMDRHASYRMVPATTEGMIQGHEEWCEQDLNTPPIRVLRRDGTEAQYLPMRQPVQLWEEVDPVTPFLDGRVNTNLWLRMDDSGWS